MARCLSRHPSRYLSQSHELKWLVDFHKFRSHKLSDHCPSASFTMCIQHQCLKVPSSSPIIRINASSSLFTPFTVIIPTPRFKGTPLHVLFNLVTCATKSSLSFFTQLSATYALVMNLNTPKVYSVATRSVCTFKLYNCYHSSIPFSCLCAWYALSLSSLCIHPAEIRMIILYSARCSLLRCFLG
ncbi:hypothetical protein OG21DRAFT_1070178 [Imleria badia]|nr:hypothetical protein OG21DRAFT_1070178 [Imleria badia]